MGLESSKGCNPKGQKQWATIAEFEQGIYGSNQYLEKTFCTQRRELLRGKQPGDGETRDREREVTVIQERSVLGYP